MFNEWKGPDLFVKTRKSHVPLKAHRMAYSRPFRLSEGRRIVLYEKVLGEDGKETFEPYLQWQLPGSIDEPLLLLFWDPEAKRGGGKIIEFSPKRFRYGSYQLVNLSSTRILGYVGSKKNRFACDPWAAYISKFSHENGDRTPIAAFVESDGEASLVFSTLTIHRERKRVILFLKPARNKLNRLVFRSQSLVDFESTGN